MSDFGGGLGLFEFVFEGLAKKTVSVKNRGGRYRFEKANPGAEGLAYKNEQSSPLSR